MKEKEIKSPFSLEQNEDEVFENHSIKIDELSREIKENMSNHKALIFSQFLIYFLLFP